MKVLSTFWKLFCIFIILLNSCDLCVKMMWTSAMHFLYFSHCCFHWLLWYCTIAMLSLVEIVAAKANCLSLNCIFASSWIKLFRSITFLMMRKWEMMWLILIRWARISLHACLIFCVRSLIQLSIENMLYTSHATYIKHDFYADFLLRLKKLLREFSCNRFTVQEEWNLSLLKFQQFTS